MMPLQMLEKSLSKKVQILLKDGRTMEGTLERFDDQMNIVLGGTTEKKGDEVKKLGVILLRGNNILCISSAD